MGIFDRIKPASASSPEPEGSSYDAAKARPWFERARTVHDTSSFEYAMQCWLSGLRFDPTNMSALEGFFKSAAQFLGENSSGKVSKDVANAVGGGELGKYLSSLLEWSMKPLEAGPAVRACELAAKLNLPEPAFWIGERALAAASREKKPRKDYFVKLMDTFAKVGAFEKAAAAGEAAYRVDPTDGALSQQARNYAAQATMSRGGFDQTGQAGGFRSNIRDAAKQRQLEEAERIVKTEDVKDSVLAAAEEEFKKRPDDLPTINRIVKALRERGKPEDESRALAILDHAYDTTKQFTFRMTTGEIRLKQERRKVAALKEKLQAAPGDEALKSQFNTAVRAFVEFELNELRLKSEAYPTDAGLKYDIGLRQFQLGRFEDAVASLQESLNDAKHRAGSLNIMGQAFLKMDLPDEAITTFRAAMDVKDLLPEQLLEIRYFLMISLMARAEHSRDIVAAEEAEKLASAILVQNIGYRDIRARREALKKLLGELKAKPV